MHLILDMDHTLIKHQIQNNTLSAIPRPYLFIFFSYIFTHFETVSIWTHATDEWYDIVYEKIFKNMIPNNNKFFFVWTRKQCIEENERTGLFSSQTNVIKPLKKVYFKYKNFNNTNTLVIDDTPSTYKYNIENAIFIKPYIDNNDDELLRLIQIFESKFNPEQRKLYNLINNK